MSVKRPAEETVPALRKTRIKLASPSPERTGDSDTESIHSCQGYKTELATDTSDTSSPPPLPPPPLPPPPVAQQTEYEVIEQEDEKLNFYLSDESEPDNHLQEELCIAVPVESSDNAVLGDTSEENSTSPTSTSDVDPELPRNDYLDFEKCLLCQTQKKNISYPYCAPCFTWKKNFFPSRPKRRLRDFKRNNSKISGVNDGLCDDSGVGSTEGVPSEDAVDGPSQPSTSGTNSVSSSTCTDNPDSCRVCFLRPENGLFVHLNTAHRYGCYSCAKKIWYNNGGCPLCRRKVCKITQLHS